MKLSFVMPHQELRPYIESFWVFESLIGLPRAASTIAAPNGCCKLTFAYGNSFISTRGIRVLPNNRRNRRSLPLGELTEPGLLKHSPGT
jgi:Domain of unknown function (DUF6597)